MDDLNRFRLLHGPYKSPVVRIGDRVMCERLDQQVEIGGMSAGPIPWPTGKRCGCPSIILFGDLIRAVQTESEIAVAHWWGVSMTTVYKWRKALGVGRVAEGTNRLYEEYYPEKQPAAEVDHAEIGRAGGAVRGEQLRGNPAHPNTRAALLANSKAPKSTEWKRKAADRGRERMPKGSMMNPNHKPWTPEEEKILGTDFDRIIAGMLSRSIHAVRCRRLGLKIPAFKGRDRGNS